jgi:hypothetical protein
MRKARHAGLARSTAAIGGTKSQLVTHWEVNQVGRRADRLTKAILRFPGECHCPDKDGGARNYPGIRYVTVEMPKQIQRLRHNQRLPDLTDPSPPQPRFGWRAGERRGLVSRIARVATARSHEMA